MPLLKYELLPQTDEGEVTVDVELAVGTRIERTAAVLIRLEDMIRQAVPEATTLITTGGGGGMGGGPAAAARRTAATSTSGSKPKSERTRSNDEIAQALRRQLSRPARRHHPRAPVGRQLGAQPRARRRQRLAPVAGDPRRRPRRLAAARRPGARR